jgi:HEAT repeat protein
VLERLGQAEDLAFAAALLRSGSEEDLERAVLAVARRDRRALSVLEGLVRHVRTDVRVAFLRAVDGLGTLEAVVWMSRCGEHSADVRSEALARLGRLAESLAHPAPEEALSLVHGVLGGIGGIGLRDAVIAAGRIEDGDSVPYLIALLSERDPGLRADAAWSLQRITGLLLRDRKERWEDWYAAELEWWRERSELAFAELEGSDHGACTRALLEVSSHHSSRDRLSLRVIPLLQDSAPDVARLAAHSLRVLRSKVACAALVEALERPEPEVAKEAWLALRAITRKDLPNEAALWRAARGP